MAACERCGYLCVCRPSEAKPVKLYLIKHKQTDTFMTLIAKTEEEVCKFFVATTAWERYEIFELVPRRIVTSVEIV